MRAHVATDPQGVLVDVIEAEASRDIVVDALEWGKQYQILVEAPGRVPVNRRVQCVSAADMVVSVDLELPGATTVGRILRELEAWDKRRVEVSGFLVLQFEHTALYDDPVDAKFARHANGLWVDLDPTLLFEYRRLSGKYVTLVGEVDAFRGGHLGLFAGTLRNVEVVRQAR